MDIAVWALVAFILLIVIRRNISFFEIPFFNLCVAYGTKMSTFGIHRLDWLMVSKRFPWNAKYETVYRWLAYFIFIYTIMDLKS
jgi:hypothetical protein